MKVKNKLLTILIAITLVFNFIILNNFNTYANTVENRDKNKITDIITTDENPIYKWLNIKEYSPKKNINSKSIPTFNSLEEATVFLRSEMVNRKGNISFILEDTTYYDGIWKDILYSSMEDYENNTSSEGDYLYRHYSSCKVKLRYSNTQIEFEYEMSYLSTYEQEEQVDKAVKEVLDNLDIEEKDDYTKIKLIHDYIVENIRYDYGYNNYSAYNAIIDKKVVCQGFSSLTYKMFKEAGLKVRIISGIGNGGAHAWNIVKLDDEWYNIDNTWDSCYSESGPISYEWFLKDEYSFPDHTRDSEYDTSEFNKNYPMATTAYNYITATGITLDNYNISMMKGDTQILTATVSPTNATNKNIIWKSSDENIVTVDTDGKVTAVDIGEAIITAISTSGTNLKATCKVTVRSNEKPIIIGIEDKFIELGEKLDPLVGITVSDYEDGDITQNIKIEGDVNVNQVGEYKLTYTVIDSDGNITTAISIITVNYKKEDINNDGVIDIVDLANIASNYNKNKVDENWNEKYDINNDDIIDILDLVLIAKKIEEYK